MKSVKKNPKTVTYPSPMEMILPNLKGSVFSLFCASFVLNLFGLAIPVLMLQVYDRIITGQKESAGTLAILAGGVALVLILEFLLKTCRSYITGWAGAKFEHQAMSRSIRNMIGADIDAVEKENIAQHLQSTTGISKLREFYSGQPFLLLVDLPFSFIFLWVIYYLGGILVIMPAALMVAFVFLSLRVGSRLKDRLVVRENDDDERFRFIMEHLHGIHTIKSFGLENQFLRRYEHFHTHNSLANYEVSKISSAAYSYASMFPQIMLIGVIALGAPMVVAGQITMGVLAASILLSGRSLLPLQKALGLWMRFQEFTLAQEKAYDMFRIPQVDKVKPEDVPSHDGHLIFRDVGHCFEGHDPLFHHIDFEVKPGDSISIFSERESGKTALLYLALGLYDASEGKVTIDGVESYRYPLSDMPHVIGYLPPEPIIFHGTVAENITCYQDGQLEAHMDVVKQLGLDEMVSRLPEGYNTMLFGTYADPIAPGVKQLITVARTLVHEPKILLFDEADMIMDEKEKEYLYNYLSKRSHKMGMVIVSHNSYFRQLAKRHFTLKDGVLTPDGMKGKKRG